MEQTDWLFWGIAFTFYLPLHAGAPLLYLLLQGDIERFKAQKNRIISHSLLSAALAFLIAIFAWPHSHSAAILTLLIATLAPWISVKKS